MPLQNTLPSAPFDFVVAALAELPPLVCASWGWLAVAFPITAGAADKPIASACTASQRTSDRLHRDRKVSLAIVIGINIDMIPTNLSCSLESRGYRAALQLYH